MANKRRKKHHAGKPRRSRRDDRFFSEGGISSEDDLHELFREFGMSSFQDDDDSTTDQFENPFRNSMGHDTSVKEAHTHGGMPAGKLTDVKAVDASTIPSNPTGYVKDDPIFKPVYPIAALPGLAPPRNGTRYSKVEIVNFTHRLVSGELDDFYGEDDEV